MADSVSINYNWSIQKDGKNLATQGSFSYTPASSFKNKFVQSIATSITKITFPNMTTVKAFSADNLDAANFVSLYIESGGTTPFAVIAAGASLPPMTVSSAVSYWGKADTAAVKLEFTADGAS